MDKAERKAVMVLINKAIREDDMETAIKLAKTFPAPPEVANAFKVGFGAEELKSWGFNLSEAEKAYGPDWLNS